MSLLISNVNGQNSPGYVFVPAVGASNLRGAHTMCCRIRFTSNPTNIDIVPIAYTADADLGGSWIERRNGDAGGAFFCKRWNAAFTLNDSSSVGGYTTGWQHFAMTYDATNIRTYLNGVLVSTTASLTTRTDNSTSNRLFIGFGGQYVIADCGWFSRVLNADEILYLKNNRLGIVLSKGDCFGWYPLFADSFRKDWSGNGNDLADWTGTGTAPVTSNEDPGVLWGDEQSRVFQVLSSAVAAVGDGRTVFNGSGARAVAVASVADGRTVFNGSATASVAVASVADGRTVLNANAAPTLGVQADGRTTFNGAATSTAAIAALGDGRTVLNGLGTQTATATATGDGRTLFNGSATNLSGTAGDGQTLFNGSATATVAIAASADGLTLFNGLAVFSAAFPDIIQRSGGGGGRHGPRRIFWTDPLPPQTYVSVLGDKLVDYWHSEQGITLDGSLNVQNWAGQLRGFLFDQPTAGKRPAYGADSTFFNSKSVVQCSNASASCLAYVPGTNIYQTTDKPAVVHVSRLRTTPAAIRVALNVFRAPATDSMTDQTLATGTRRRLTNISGVSQVVLDEPSNTVAAMNTVGLTATELETWSNGQKTAGAFATRNLQVAPNSVAIGSYDQAGTNVSDSSFAMVFLCRSMPNPFEQLQLYGLAKAEWGI